MLDAMMALKTFIIILVIFLTGCVAGGGGSQNTTPNTVDISSGYEVTMELTVWGSESKNLENRYTEIVLNYDVSGKNVKGLVMPKFIGMKSNKLIVMSLIPSIDGIKSGDQISCVYKYKFDGHDNSTPITFTVK
jgi:hypothetical protein